MHKLNIFCKKKLDKGTVKEIVKKHTIKKRNMTMQGVSEREHPTDKKSNSKKINS